MNDELDVNSIITSSALAKGFAGVYFISPKDRETGAVVLLIYHYKPFEIKTRIPAYYIYSNKSYHASKALIRELQSQNIECESVDLHLKRTAVDNKIGAIGKNSLLHLKTFGSRIIMQAFYCRDAVPIEYNEVAEDICSSCNLCAKMCPLGAIDVKNGLDVKKCIRYKMDTLPYDDSVRENLTTYLGCEVCMACCPYNAKIEFDTPSEDLINAFEPQHILDDNANEIRSIVGKNIKRSRILEEAKIILWQRKHDEGK